LSTSRILDQLRRLPEDHQLPSGSICIGIDHIPDGDVALLDPRVEASSAAILQYTSGSASKPKGVIVSHGNLLHNSECIRHRFGHTSQSQGVIWLPPYHDMGLIGGILQPLYSGFPVALMSPLTFIQRPLRWLRAISEYAATTSGGPNFAFQLCIDQISDQDAAELDLASWRVAFTGGEQVRRATLRAFAEKFRPAGFSDKAFLPCYGMAETTLMLSGRGDRTVPEPIQAARSSLGETASGTGGALSMGPIVADMDAVIVDPATCRRCPDGVEGEIWVRGPSVAHGYWNQPQAIGLLTASIEGDAGGYLRTGDLGFMHAGELHITGRIKDMIIIHGMNHYPHDLEETVAACGGAIRSGGVAAFSVVVEDKERLVVVLEVDPRKLDHELGKILGDVREAIAEAHGIQVWELVVVNPGGVPKTSSGKLQRFAARQRYLARSFAPVSRSPMAAPAGP
jgi:acyl-CoA synthetase (AMP-forming)/AMP-acid ligase II